MSALPVNPTPKQEFIAESANISAHNSLIELPAFERAVKTALAEFVRQTSMNTPGDATPAAAQMFRIQGAHGLVDVLLHLAETPSNVTPIPRGNLNHKV